MYQILLFACASLIFFNAFSCEDEFTQQWYENEEYVNDYIKQFHNYSSPTLLSDYKKFSELVPIGSMVLDIAIGSGRDYFKLFEMGYQVHGNEHSNLMRERARAILNGSVGENDVRVSGYEFSEFGRRQHSQKYDAVWSMSSLNHFKLEDFTRYLFYMLNPVKSGGVLFLSTQYNKEPISRLYTLPGQDIARTMTAINEEFLTKALKRIKFRYGIHATIEFNRIHDLVAPGVQWWSLYLRRKY